MGLRGIVKTGAVIFALAGVFPATSFADDRGVPFAIATSSDNIPQMVLDRCDANAKDFGAHGRPVDTAIESLTALDIFSENEFRNVRIGFCNLQQFHGPVATASCARDTILLDRKYLGRGEELGLASTLAHEMKHIAQHREKKIAFGETYCSSKQYEMDKAELEQEAARFGDEAANLLFLASQVK